MGAESSTGGLGSLEDARVMVLALVPELVVACVITVEAVGESGADTSSSSMVEQLTREITGTWI